MHYVPHNVIYLHRLHLATGSGQTIQVFRDNHALAGLGHSVHLFYRDPKEWSPSQLVELMQSYGLSSVPTLNIHWIREGLTSRRRLLRQATDLIANRIAGHANVIITRTIDHAAAAARIKQRMTGSAIKLVVELHETAIPHLVYAEQGRRWKAGLSKRAERHVFTNMDGIVCTAAPQLTLLDRCFPGHARAVVLPNSVDTKPFSDGDKHKIGNDGKFHLRYAGQFSAWKNTAVMLQALSVLPDDVVLDIAGGKPGQEQETEAALAGTAERYGVAQRFKYYGFLQPKDVPLFLMAADALLLPLGNNVQSRYFTSPLKLFEYAASGVPMIVTRQPTIESLIEDGVHALMVEPGSATVLAQAVTQLYRSPALGQSLVKSIKKWVRQFSRSDRAMRFHKFLNELDG